MKNQIAKTKTMIRSSIAVFIISMMTGCVGGDPEVAGENAQEVNVPRDFTWHEGSEADKVSPTEEDEVARYYPDEGRVELLEGHDDVINTLDAEGVLVQPIGDLIVDRIPPHELDRWWPQVICNTPHYIVYKNARCGDLHPGYSYTLNNYPWWKYWMQVVNRSYKTCRFCAGCGYCVERKNALVGWFTMYAPTGNPIYTGGYKYRNACYVY